MKRLGTFTMPTVPTRLPSKGPDCATCDDTTWLAVDKADRSKGVRRCPDCYERRRGFAPGVPDTAGKVSLDSYHAGELQATDANRPALLQAKFFLDAVHPGLYLHGAVGSGKTLLACAILNDLHRTGQSVRFVRVTDLLKQIVQPDTGDQVLQKMIDVPVLVLDDIGSQKGSDYARQALLQVFDGRVDRGHRTIWTSNLSLDELVTFFGDDKRLASRIAGNAKIVLMDGQDYRLKKAKARK